MALITGSPISAYTSQEDIYLESAPTLFFQDAEANPFNNPDSDGFYWQLSGTSTYGVFEIGCITDVSLADNITMNDVLCDNIGVKDTLQQRNYVEFNLTVQSFFPFEILTNILRGGAVTNNAGENTSKFGIGKINNNQFWMVWAPKVYDESVGDYLGFQLHKAKFVDAWTINMPFGSPWQAAGIKLRAFADTDKPSAQQFVTVIRADISVL